MPEPPALALSRAHPFPRPQRQRERAGCWVLPEKVPVHGPPAALGSPGVAWLERALEARGHRLVRSTEARPGHGVCLEAGPLEPFAPVRVAGEAYGLRVDASAARLAHASSAGLQHALATLSQLVLLASGAPGRIELRCLEIEDFPDFPQRGAMLDISRDKVPTLETLRALIDQLARWKVNQLQLYMEHTFAYAGHEAVWKAASALSAAEVRELDAWCAARHIELVPNQNSFGHMQRWLVHEPYRRLAECPDGFDHPWNWTKDPYGLCPTDAGSLRLLEDLYDQLLPNFTSRQFNVGLDETIDLGVGRSRARCEALGTERVYLDFLKQVHDRVTARGRVMQFWGDIIVKRPDLMPDLPRGAVALEWGYEADHPFAEHLALFQKAGLEFQVCPGTSSWNSIAGRTENALGNLARAAREGKAAGAIGMLVTDWGDHGHLQPLPVSYLGLFAGAAFAWNVADAEPKAALDLPALLDAHVFEDQAGVLGRAAYDLGNAYREAGSLRPNASALFWSIVKPERLFSPPGVTRESLQRTLAYLDSAGAALPRARPGALWGSPEAGASRGTLREGARVVAELAWARDLLCFACRLGLARCASPGSAPVEAVGQLPAATRADLRSELEPLVERHRALWLERNREGGLNDSARRLTAVLDALRA